MVISRNGYGVSNDSPCGEFFVYKNLVQGLISIINKFMRLALIIGAVVVSTAIIGSGFFIVKNEKEKSKQSDERLKEMQVSMKKMETKLEEVNKETGKKNKEENVVKESEEDVVEKIVVQKPLQKEVQKEKNISCVLSDGSVEEVSELECEVLKNKDAMRKEINDDYDDCMKEVNEEFSNCLDSGERKSKSDLDYGESKITQGLTKCMEISNRDSESCKSKKNKKLFNLK